MARKSYEEKIDDIQKQINRLQKREKDIRKQKTEKERKERTRRLIELGGIIESVLGRATVDEDKKKLLEFLNKQEQRGKYFSRAMNNYEGCNSDNGDYNQ